MKAVTVFAPIKLAKGKTEVDLLAASELFQTNFVAKEPGVLRRELVRDPKGGYLDIVLFRSAGDAADVMKKEMESPDCHAFFAVMDLGDMDADTTFDPHPVLAIYEGN